MSFQGAPRANEACSQDRKAPRSTLGARTSRPIHTSSQYAVQWSAHSGDATSSSIMRARLSAAVSARNRVVTSAGGIVPATSSHARRSQTASLAGAVGTTPAFSQWARMRASTSAAERSAGLVAAACGKGWDAASFDVTGAGTPRLQAASVAAIAAARALARIMPSMVFGRTRARNRTFRDGE
jgi:hypothetical protein